MYRDVDVLSLLLFITGEPDWLNEKLHPRGGGGDGGSLYVNHRAC